LTHGERALALARNIGETDLIVQSLDALVYVKMQLGEWEEDEQLVTEAHALYVAMKDRAMEADCLCLLANAHLHRGRPQAGIMRPRPHSALIAAELVATSQPHSI